MTKGLKGIFVLMFLAGGIFMVVGNGAHAGSATEAGTLVSSRTLYRQHCAECHGNNGRSQTAKGRETEASDLTDPGVKGNAYDKNVRIITNGKGDMPGFKRSLTSAQITSITRYIKTL